MKLVLRFAVVHSLCFYSLAAATVNNRFMGPYQIIVRELGKCDTEGTNEFRIVSNKIRKYNRTTYVFSSDYIFPYGLSDDSTITASVAVFGNGGWKNNYFHQKIGGFCMCMSFAPQYMKQFFDKIGVESCPVPPGNYTANNMILNIDSKWPSIPYNRYRCDFLIEYGGKLVGCKRLYFDSVPKNNKKN